MKYLVVFFGAVVAINAASYKFIPQVIENNGELFAPKREIRDAYSRHRDWTRGRDAPAGAAASAQTQSFGGFGNNFGLPFGGNFGKGSIGGGLSNSGGRAGAGASSSGSADSTANAQTQTFTGNGFSGSASSASASSHSSGGFRGRAGQGATAQASALSQS